MTDRERLPDRRLTLTEEFPGDGRDWSLSVGFNPAGCAKEIFLSGAKAGSDYEGLLHDACILTSRLFQMGVSPEMLADSLGRGGMNGANHASPLGQAIALATVIEREDGGALRAVYQAAGVVP